MATGVPTGLISLDRDDETAWLDATADLVRAGRLHLVDAATLAEYLTDMTQRDRREVESRLTVLLMHWFKWTYQPDQRSNSWRATIVEQRQELRRLAGRGVLRHHAAAVITDVYPDAVERAVAETGLPTAAFPADCPYTAEGLIGLDFAD